LLKLTISNGGWASLEQPKLKVTSADPSITFDNGGEVALGALEPYAEVVATIGIKAGGTSATRGVLALTVSLSDPEALMASADLPLAISYNFDDQLSSSATDDVESEKTTWSYAENLVPDVWSREGDPTNHVWHADDVGTQGDESLVSPDLVVSARTPLTISFRHRYSFEIGQAVDNGPVVGFDGSVLEISEDGGGTWHDVSEYGSVDYPDVLYEVPEDAGPDAEPYAANPLAGRPAWVGESANYPSYSRVSINLGLRFARKTIKVRFRIGTDEGTGAPGWDIDNISFGGSSPYALSAITNTPFARVVNDATRCTPPRP
jgi:hypothetical protein